MSELDSVAGGDLGNSEDAPDGHEMGCFFDVAWFAMAA